MTGGITQVLSETCLSAISFRWGQCPACGPTVYIKFDNNEMAVRCIRCRASPVSLSLIRVAELLNIRFDDKFVYEMSSRGPLVRFLRRKARKLACSEYFETAASGDLVNGVQCQDVEHLTYFDEQFDLCTSTEVFEHVANDIQGFGEIRRVLKKGGLFLFTVPMTGQDKTIERARREDGKTRHLLEPEYHGDRLRGQNRVLCYRNYGRDIVSKLLDTGFSRAEIRDPGEFLPWPYQRPVVVAWC